jgi:hypothetical protein
MSYSASHKIVEAIRILKECRGEVVQYRSLLDNVINEVADLFLKVEEEEWNRDPE